MADQDGAALFWKWLLAVSLVIMLAIGGYAGWLSMTGRSLKATQHGVAPLAFPSEISPSLDKTPSPAGTGEYHVEGE